MKKIIILLFFFISSSVYASDLRTGSIFGGMVNVIPKYATTTSLGNSSITDDGTTVTMTEQMQLPNLPTAITSGNYAIQMRSGITSTAGSSGYIFDVTSAVTSTDRTLITLTNTGVPILQITADRFGVYFRGGGPGLGIYFAEPNVLNTLGVKPTNSSFVTQLTGAGANIAFAGDNGVGSNLNLRVEGTILSSGAQFNDMYYGNTNTFSIGSAASPMLNMYQGIFGKHFYGKNQESSISYDGNNLLLNPDVVSDGINGRLILSGNVEGGDLENVGTNLVTNPTFTPDCFSWTLSTGWTCTNNAVIHNSSGTGPLSQVISSLTISTMYILSFTTGTYLGNNGSGQMTPSIMGKALQLINWSVLRSGNSSPGTFNVSFVATSTTSTLLFTPTSGMRGALSNITISPLGQNVTLRYPNIVALNITTTNQTIGSLTSGRIPSVSTGGLIADYPGLTWDTTYGLKAQTLYGEMWYHNDGPGFFTQVLTANTPTIVSCFDAASNGQTLNGFSYLVSSLTTSVSGKYNASWSTSIGSSSSNHKHHFWLSINGVEQLSTENHCKPINSSDVISCSHNPSILTLVVGDIINLYVLDETAGETLTVYSASVNLARVDN